MNLKDVDLVKISKLTSQQIDHITCLECCKYYIAPETAACGHTLCHSCWRGRRTCPSCAKPFERHNLKYNSSIQNLTEHVHELGEAFEKLFNIKLDEFLLDVGEVESENDATKNVKDWLASSQNHFSAPAHSSEQSQEIQQHPNLLNVSSNKIQIHTNIPKPKSPEKIIHVPLPQDDWDKIEIMPDTEDNKKNKENVVGPMDIEPFDFYDNEYTANNPRRSSRKREFKPTDVNNKINDNNSLDKQSFKDSSGEIDKKSNKNFQNWNNVKRMRKEFSKLNKKNRNKLNVSIEMCKKTPSTAKTNAILPAVPSSQVYDIDENTPDHFNMKTQIKEVLKEHNTAEDTREKTNISTNNEIQIQESSKQLLQNVDHNPEKNNSSQETNAETVHSSKHEVVVVTEKAVKMPFYKRSALYPKCVEENTMKAINHIVDSNTTANDDIEITIKVGNTITNIFIKKKNDIELKVKTDREIQTSLGEHEVMVKNKTLSQNTKSENIIINVGDNNKVDVEHQSNKQTNPRIEELRKVNTSLKTVSEKKNTDSADTGTAQFEITESVEKELSKVMECVDVNEPMMTSNSTPIEKDVTSQNNKSVKPTTSLKSDDLEYLNDLDIFESESVKESDVKQLKNTEHAPSEILLCTFKSKNKTQKHIEKRNRDTNEDTLPKSKKAKHDNENSAVANETIEPKNAKQNQTESEPMNYDAIMGSVFASIDADIKEIRQSQNTLKDNNKEFEQDNCEATRHHKAEETHKIVMSGTDQINSSIHLINEYQKDSENIFSVCVEKDENVDGVPTNEKVLSNVPPPNLEEFLTPVMCRNLESTGEALIIDNDVEMANDDSESIVEETPQKTTSFLKLKQKSNGANKDVNLSQRIELSEQRVLPEKKSSESTKLNIKSIVNITDTSTELKSTNNVTAIEIVDEKALETPLNINKFVQQIQHKSTPYARKSLNFDTENMDIPDPEQTLCQTNEVAKTTQEKEIMSKAFEKTPTTPAVRPLGLRNLALKNKRLRIAGSCLTVAEIARLKVLCSQHKWTYSDKYSKDLTHLVVGLDDENKSQRSVKYMCALASSIWIISYEWVEKCLVTNSIVSEEYFEALDSTGEPGPRRSRLASKKLFQGITFFCMEPFGVLDVDTLKGMLEAAGGKVVKEAKEVRVNDKSCTPAILLAEPENTQEDRFIYLAMELSIVPVNYEWVLNCLGSYTLGSVQELLLCPASLLPKATKQWPSELLARDED